MSVRRNTAKAPSRSMNNMNGGANLLKSLAFWLLLAGGSFVIGLFIISPLINAAQSHSAPAVQPSPNPSPTAVAAPAAPRHEEEKATRRAPDAAVDISPETKTPEENTEVQKPAGLDENNAAPPTRSENSGEGDTNDRPRRRRDSSRDENGDASSRSDRPDRSEGVQRSDNLENSDENDTSTRSSRTGRATHDASSDTNDDPKPRRHRRTAPRDTEETPRRTRDTSRDNGVQRSEGIDR